MRSWRNAEDALSAMLTIKYAILWLLDGARLRTKRRKCVVSGCEIPARGFIGRGMLPDPWLACGVHRRPISELLNAAHRDYVDQVSAAADVRMLRLITGLDDLADHSKELALAE